MLSKVNREIGVKKKMEAIRELPVGAEGQQVNAANPSIRDIHRSEVMGLISTLKKSGLYTEIIQPNEALAMMRHYVSPGNTHENWMPVTVGDPIPFRASGARDFSDTNYPSLSSQIFSDGFKETDKGFIVVPGRKYAFVHMQIWPRTPGRFSELIKNAATQKIPFSMNIKLTGGALKGTTSRLFWATILKKFSVGNARYKMAIDELKQAHVMNETLATVQMTCSTWADESESDEVLSLRVSGLSSMLQGWGGAQTTTTIGDVGMAFASSFPGMNRSSSAPASIAPLEDIVCMFPMDHQLSLWKEGNFILRNGSMMLPFEQGSRLQSASVDMGFAPMGAGKSVALNTYNFAYILQGERDLPWLSILDVGVSSYGLIRALQASLPDEKKHLVIYRRLRLEAKYAINMFDLPLGLEYPLPLHVATLKRWMVLLCSDHDNGTCDESIPGIAEACIKEAYESRRESESPRMYVATLDQEIDQRIKRYGFNTNEPISWYRLRDLFFERNDIFMATRAQRYAVPTLLEVATRANNPTIKDAYTKEDKGERITAFFYRKIGEAINQLKIINSYTQFDISSARVISLDLDEVAKGDAWSTAVVYMMAMHVTTSHFFSFVEDVEHYNSAYQDYQSTRIREIRASPKRLCFDEIHRITKQPMIVDQIIDQIDKNVREGRKWKLHIGMYSQLLDDIPEQLIALTQTRFIMGTGSTKDERLARDKFNLTDSAVLAIRRIGSPDVEGANMVAIYRTNGGQIVQFATNTLGSMMMWLFTTEPSESTLRDLLYGRMSVREAITMLANRYRSDYKISDEIRERMTGLVSITDFDITKDKSVLEGIADDIVKKLDDLRETHRLNKARAAAKELRAEAISALQESQIASEKQEGG